MDFGRFGRIQDDFKAKRLKNQKQEFAIGNTLRTQRKLCSNLFKNEIKRRKKDFLSLFQASSDISSHWDSSSAILNFQIIPHKTLASNFLFFTFYGPNIEHEFRFLRRHEKIKPFIFFLCETQSKCTVKLNSSR